MMKSLLNIVKNFLKARQMANKMICPRCMGNGYIRIPNEAVGIPKQIIAQCTMCDSQGEIDEINSTNDVNTTHKLQ
jgi:DnaJ-class molecular chaperone